MFHQVPRSHDGFVLSMIFSGEVAQMVKNLLGMQEMRVQSPGREDPLGEENDHLLQFSCLENPMDRGDRWTTVHRVAKSQTPLSNRTTD